MDERSLLELWNKYRNQLILAQLAPTFLLITTVGLVQEIRNSGWFTIWATLGILAASGILGALAEYSAAHEAQAVSRDLAALTNKLTVSESIVSNAKWLHLAKYLTPAIFVGIFVFVAAALLQ